jgi:sulfopyruvate decarboxylase TPP-binding subunit
LVGLQGLLGLVEEDEGIDLVVEDAEERVGVVCAGAHPEARKTAAAVATIARSLKLSQNSSMIDAV